MPGPPGRATVAIPRWRTLPPALGIIRSRTGNGRKVRSFSCVPQLVEELLDARARPRCSGRFRRPPRPCAHPCCPAPDPTPPTGTPDRRRGCTDHRTGDEDHHRPNGAAWSGSPVPVAPPETARAPIRRYSPTTSGHSSILPADLLAPFAMCTPLACSDYYGASAPSRGHRSATDLPTSRAGCPAGRATAGWFPRSPRNRSMREAPAFTPTASPRLRRSPSTWPPHRTDKPASELTAHRAEAGGSRTAHRPLSVRFEPALDLRGFRQRFLSYAFSSVLAGPEPSDSADPSRTLSGLLPPSRAFPRPGCPQLHRSAATDRR